MSNGYRDEVRRLDGEAGFTLVKFFKWVVVLMVLCFAIGMFGRLIGWFDNAGAVAAKEYSAETMLNRYNWFKDAAAQLDARQANIKVYRKRQENMVVTYGVTPRAQWDRTDKESFNLWEQEVAGMIASYNSLTAEYNAAMAKSQWAFTNTGSLPKGADKPLPREIRTYHD